MNAFSTQFSSNSPDLSAQIAEMVHLCRDGRYVSALELVDAALRQHAASALLLNNRGLILESLQKPAEAEQAYRKAILFEPACADSYYNLALLIHNLPAKFEEAVSLCRKAIALDPRSVGPLIALGCIYQSQSMWPQAQLCHEQALALQPESVEAHQNLGLIFAATNNHGKAIEHLQQALLSKPDCSRTWNDLGISLRAAGHVRQAIGAYDKALELDPSCAHTWYHKGNALQDLGMLPQAAKAYIRALKLQNNNRDYWNNLGVVWRAMNENKRAVQAYRQAIACSPQTAEPYNNLGLALEALRRSDEAIVNFQKAVLRKPDFAEAFRNMADSCKELCQTTAAIQNYRRALSLRPDCYPAWWNLSLTLLLDGQLQEGFSLYLYRTQPELEIFTYPHNLPALRWNGRAFANKTLLIYCEQGLGDSIQFARYVPLVRKLGGTVVLEAQPQLVRLFEQSQIADRVIAAGPTPPAVDYDLCASIMDLPALFKTSLETIPGRCPYLTGNHSELDPPPGLINPGRFNVGIVWAGNPKHGNDKNRSCPPELFGSLIKGWPDIQFFSLQKGHAAGQIAEMRASNLIDLHDSMTDFASTAALMERMDLIISVDTSTAHLAGALGRPSWTLLPFSPDWRWLLKRDDSPWYPTMRLFRQTTRGDWHGVFDQLQAALAQLDPQKKAAL